MGCSLCPFSLNRMRVLCTVLSRWYTSLSHKCTGWDTTEEICHYRWPIFILHFSHYSLLMPCYVHCDYSGLLGKHTKSLDGTLTKRNPQGPLVSIKAAMRLVWTYFLLKGILFLFLILQEGKQNQEILCKLLLMDEGNLKGRKTLWKL